MPDTELTRDEGIRADSLAREAGQAQAGVRQGRHGHRGQRVAAQRRRVRGADRQRGGRTKAGREPIARIAGRGTFAVDPDIFGIGPVEAANRALKRAGIGWGDVDAGRAQRGVRRAVARVRGRVDGARPREASTSTAARSRIGHPLGASGGRILGTLATRSRQTAASGASPRSASASARGWRWCWRRCDASATTRKSIPRWTTRATSRRALRHPKQPLIALPQRLTEVTAPVLGEDRLGELDHDLTRQHEGEPQGQRIIVHGHVKEDDGRPVPDTLVEIWQANAGGRYRHRWDNWPSPIDPNFTGVGRCADRHAGLLPLRDDPAGRVPVGQPPERLAPRAHPLQPVRARVHAAARDADVLPGRPAVLPGPDVQLGRRPRPEGAPSG